MAAQYTSNSKLAASEINWEAEMRDHMALRRELFHWKRIAFENQAELNAIHSSFSWKAAGVFRLLNGLCERWKAVCMAAVIGLITFPIWPIIFVMMLTGSGRTFLESCIARVPSVMELLQRIKYTFVNALGIKPTVHATRGVPTTLEPLVFSRVPETRLDNVSKNTERPIWELLQLLSPQKRYLLDRTKHFDPTLTAEYENPEFQSLATTEHSMIQLCMAATSQTEQTL